MIYIDIVHLYKSYETNDEKIIIYKNFNFKIREKIIAFFGPNGCGKTTLLNIICGIVKPDSGKIKFNIDGFSQDKIGYVFQSTENFLFPWMSNFDNITFPLKLKNIDKNERANKLQTLINQLDIVNIPLNAYPYQLSGGQQQIIAILRALISDPNILLLDEPFSNLDYLTKLKVKFNLLKILKNRNIVTIFVSHTIEEAIFLADRIVILSQKPTKILETLKVPFKKRNIDTIHSEKSSKLKERVLRHYKNYWV
ncbi:MAG: ATP-binding cassette domain-containing protein [Candidatus Aenigmatarchaeota archaeon]